MMNRRILFAHNRYLQRGGEDSVVEAEVDLLRTYGNEVLEYMQSNEEIERLSKFSLVGRTLWSHVTFNDIRGLIKNFRPDVIHAHNTFPLISPSLYWAASSMKVPVVQTLHNFRLICAQAMLLRDGQVCEDCLGNLPWRGVVRKCYRGSTAQSTVLVGMLGLHRILGTYSHKVARYIALNEFCRNKFIEGGLPAERIVVKPNFVDVVDPENYPREGGLFVGRLSSEKGISVLLDALDCSPDITVDVIGTGPEQATMEKHPKIRVLGWMQRSSIFERMRTASYLVMPSIWYETFGMVALEAFACGLPVIASRLGAMAELIEDGRTGLLFEAGSSQDLATKIAWAEAHPDEMREMGVNARLQYEKNYSVEKNYQQLMMIYEDAIKSAKPD